MKLAKLRHREAMATGERGGIGRVVDEGGPHDASEVVVWIFVEEGFPQQAIDQEAHVIDLHVLHQQLQLFDDGF
jgi:hypothetical protein